MPYTIVTIEAHKYAYALWKIANNQESEGPLEKRQRTERASNVFSKLCVNALKYILSFCLDGTLEVEGRWRLLKNAEVGIGTRVQIVQPFIEYASSIGLVGVKTADWVAKLDVRSESRFADVDFIHCFNIEGMPLEDVMTVTIAFNVENWMQFGPEGFFGFFFPNPRQQRIVFYVCGLLYFHKLKKVLGTDPRFVKLFPHAVVAYLSSNPTETLSDLPTNVCQAIKEAFTPSQFRFFLRKYRKSPEQQRDPLFPKA
jgi:hypothetical protein